MDNLHHNIITTPILLSIKLIYLDSILLNPHFAYRALLGQLSDFHRYLYIPWNVMLFSLKLKVGRQKQALLISKKMGRKEQLVLRYSDKSAVVH